MGRELTHTQCPHNLMKFSLCLSVCLSVSLTVSVCLSFCLCLSPSLSLCLSVSLSLSLSVSVSLCLSLSLSLSQKPLKSLHRRAIKIIILKRTSLTDKDYKAAQILPLSSRLMSNKARFEHTIVSGRAPMYLSTKLLINQSWRYSSRKLNVPIPRIDLFKSCLVYFGPALWNSLPSELRLPVSPSVFKKHLTLHMLSLVKP